MAVSKISFIFVILIFASNYNPACGQAARTPVDFWLTFGQQVTQNLLNWILNLDIIPDDILDDLNPRPTAAPIDPNQLRIAIVNGQPVILPSNTPVTPAPTTRPPGFISGVPAPQPTPAPMDPTWQLWKVLFDLYATKPNPPATPAPMPPNNNYWPVTTPSPCTTTPKCPGGECKPEKVRIVVVDDCKNQKHSSESYSEESSEEIDVIVPRRKSSRHH